MIKVEHRLNVSTGEDIYVANISVSDIVCKHLPEAILHKVAQAIADRYVLENFPQIAAKLDQNAIANLAIADASKKIAEEIKTRPVVIEHDADRAYRMRIM